MSRGLKFTCRHCSRVVGRLTSTIVMGECCSLCSKDYQRVRAIATLAFRVRRVPGTPPEVMGKLFLKWAELTGESAAGEAMRALMDGWAREDAGDPAEKEARGMLGTEVLAGEVDPF